MWAFPCAGVFTGIAGDGSGLNVVLMFARVKPVYLGWYGFIGTVVLVGVCLMLIFLAMMVFPQIVLPCPVFVTSFALRRPSPA